MGNKLLKFLVVIIFLGVCGVIIYQQLRPRSSQVPVTSSPSEKPKAADPLPKEALHISFYQSSGKKDWVDEVVTEFNNGNYQVNKKPIVVDVAIGYVKLIF